jgi:hypothetical protein
MQSCTRGNPFCGEAPEPNSKSLPKVFTRIGQIGFSISMMLRLEQLVCRSAFGLKHDIVERFKRNCEVIPRFQSTKCPKERNTDLVKVSESAVRR